MKKMTILVTMIGALLLIFPHLTTLTLCKIVYADDKTELSDADKNFLRQCQITQADIDIIPQLGPKTQAKISQWIASKDCKNLEPFKNARNYYRQLKPNTHPPRPPEGFTASYLTRDEVIHYQELLNISPWAR